MRDVFKSFSVYTLLMLFLVGCATNAVKSPADMAVSHGYVVGSVHSDMSLGLTLKSANGKEVFLPADLSLLSAKGVGGWVPAGSYEIVNLINRSIVGNDVISIRKDSLPKIEVKSGHITDINHLIPVNLGEGKQTVLSIARKEPFTPYVAEANSDLFSGKAPISWVAEGELAESTLKMGGSGQGLIIDWIIHAGRRSQQAEQLDLLSQVKTHEDAFDLIKAYRQPSTALLIDHEGNSYFGTQTGQVRFKKAEIWGVMDTGYLDAVIALDIRSDGTITVGLDSGKLIQSSDNGKNWNLKYQLPKNELFFGIKSFPGKQFVATWIPDANSGVYLSHVGQKINPVMKLYEVQGDLLTEVLQMKGKEAYGCCFRPIFAGTKKALYLAMPADQIQVYDVESSSGRFLKLQKPFSGFWVNDEESFMTVWLAGGMFSTAFFSDDQGASWKSLPKPPYQPRHIYLDGAQSGLMWSLAIGLNSASFKLDKLDSAKNTWQEITKSETDCLHLLPNFTKREYFCILDNGIIRTYANGKWSE